MSHQHSHKEHSQSQSCWHEQHNQLAGQNILIAFLLNFGFAIFELIGSIGISLELEKLSI